ncbi:MAG: hypothetical protein IKL07_11110 [Clostridium sp.]|nr:hypothetical protein [Clostridium sp.]
MELDFEDFIEEIKFQMTEFDRLTEDDILDWEEKARAWVDENSEQKYLKYKSADDITVKLKNEDAAVDVPQEIARLYYRAVRDDAVDKYWDDFKLM